MRRAVLAAAVLLCGVACTADSDSCPVGSAGCACTGGGACDQGLECHSDLCGLPGGAGEGSCETDADCPTGELCYNRACVDELLFPNPNTCPSAPLGEQLVCTDWDQGECPCYAGVVSFHEKDEDGRLSCAGVTGIFTPFVYFAQSGCLFGAIDNQLSGEAVGSGELKLRVGTLPDDTPCAIQAEDWIPDGETVSRPALRITCSPTCKFWMEQHPAPPQERLVPDGQFPMGTRADLLPPDRPDEGPQHLVDVTCFYMDRFEVTRGQYRQCLDLGACTPPAYAAAGEDAATFFGEAKLSLPMTFVTQAQADGFCRSLSKALPTEAEWERAARGSRDGGADYPFGVNPPFDAGSPDCALANFAPCGGAPLPAERDGELLRESGASFFGVVDLGGNVAEWTRDYYRDDVYDLRAASSGPNGAKNPEQLTPGTLGPVRVIRGGSFLDTVDPALRPPEDNLRIHARRWAPEMAANEEIGFRCVRYKPGVLR